MSRCRVSSRSADDDPNDRSKRENAALNEKNLETSSTGQGMPYSKKKAEDKPNTFRDHREKVISYSDFVNNELRLSFMADLQRSIPSMVDGLKPGQRKILFCSFKKKLYEEIIVDRLIGYVSQNFPFHGEKNLASTIIGMAQDFVGSNNINLLKPNGQFGTRNLGGKNHAKTRCIYTELNPITRCLFHENDDKLLEYSVPLPGSSIEPNWYIPIIPLVLVNGCDCEGIGTDLSSYIPNYNPREIIANVRRLLNGEKMVPMDPWYRGFRGTIEKSAKKGDYKVNGTVMEIDEQTFRITELPIGTWTEGYKKFLVSITDGSPNVKNPLIEDFRLISNRAIVDIEIRMKPDKIALIMQKGLLKKFKLTTTISTNNMHLFDAEGKIKKFDNPDQILEEFFPLRLEYYEKRKAYILANLEHLLLILDNKVRFILGVRNEEINVLNYKMADLLMELKQKGFTPMPSKGKSAEPAGANDDNLEALKDDYQYLLSMPVFGSFTLQHVEELLAEKDEKEKEFNILKATPTTSLWMADLDELEKKLDELEKDEKETFTFFHKTLYGLY